MSPPVGKGAVSAAFVRPSVHLSIVSMSHLCLFLIRETKCCTCVIRDGRGHTVSPNPVSYYKCIFDSGELKLLLTTLHLTSLDYILTSSKVMRSGW